MAVSIYLGVFFVGVLMILALVVGVYVFGPLIFGNSRMVLKKGLCSIYLAGMTT